MTTPYTPRPLSAPPAAFAQTRDAAHRLAVYAIAPARRRVTGRIGLRWMPGGFGTPAFGAGERVRLIGDRIVRERGSRVDSAVVTSLAQAAALALDGPPDGEWAAGLDVPPMGDPEAPLRLDPGAAGLLGDWYGLAFSALEELRGDPESAGAGEVQLWPEHFDAAVDAEVGDGRATFGASTGDAGIGEPYLYVLPPEGVAPARDATWNAEPFRGAAMTLTELLGAGGDTAAGQRAAALAFLRGRRGAIAGDA